jgi:hypothetical protein
MFFYYFDRILICQKKAPNPTSSVRLAELRTQF